MATATAQLFPGFHHTENEDGGQGGGNGNWRLCYLPGLTAYCSLRPNGPLHHARGVQGYAAPLPHMAGPQVPEGQQGRAVHPQPGEGGGAHGASG